MAEPVFRRAVADDRAAVVDLTRDAYAHYTSLLGGPPIPVTEDYEPRIARGEVWLLEQGTALAGLLVLEDAGDHGLIFSVAVAPGHQGQGYGIRLLREAETLTRRMGFAEVRLYTNARMERNIALYTSFGYVETGRRANPKRPGWVAVDMAKTLGPDP